MLDNPFILSMVFYSRHDEPGSSRVAGAMDGTIPVEKDIVLGYRLYPHAKDAPLLVYFHGNGEIASDYDDVARAFQQIGVSLLVVDYRGYGWSTGKPLVSTLLSDVIAVHAALPDIRSKGQLGNPPLFIMGRSLGSAPSIHLAHLYPEAFKGLIVESGFAHVMQWLASKGLPVMGIPDPVENADKVSKLHLPLLVIHAEKDTLIPISQGQALYDASPAAQKHFLRIPRAGHNDIMYIGMREYMAAIQQHITGALGK